MKKNGFVTSRRLSDRYNHQGRYEFTIWMVGKPHEETESSMDCRSVDLDTGPMSEMPQLQDEWGWRWWRSKAPAAVAEYKSNTTLIEKAFLSSHLQFRHEWQVPQFRKDARSPGLPTPPSSLPLLESMHTSNGSVYSLAMLRQRVPTGEDWSFCKVKMANWKSIRAPSMTWITLPTLEVLGSSFFRTRRLGVSIESSWTMLHYLSICLRSSCCNISSTGTNRRRPSQGIPGITRMASLP